MARNNKRKTKGRFVGIPYHVASSNLWKGLSAHEVKLLFDLSYQYNGKNNGNLTAAHSLLRDRTWASSTLARTLNSLINRGLVVVTRQGWKQRGKPTLLALTWYGIDDPPLKVDYDEGIQPSPVPLSYWAVERTAWKHQPRVKNLLAKNISPAKAQKRATPKNPNH